MKVHRRILIITALLYSIQNDSMHKKQVGAIRTQLYRRVAKSGPLKQSSYTQLAVPSTTKKTFTKMTVTEEPNVTTYANTPKLEQTSTHEPFVPTLEYYREAIHNKEIEPFPITAQISTGTITYEEAISIALNILNRLKKALKKKHPHLHNSNQNTTRHDLEYKIQSEEDLLKTFQKLLQPGYKMPDLESHILDFEKSLTRYSLLEKPLILEQPQEYFAAKFIERNIIPHDHKCSLFTQKPEDDNFGPGHHSKSGIFITKINMPPSVILFLILHEYRHHIQSLSAKTKQQALNFYPNQVLQAANDQIQVCWSPTDPEKNEKWMIYEHDADLFAASSIKCPVCLTIVSLGEDHSKNGYFSPKQILSFVKAENPTCPAHSLKANNPDHNLKLQALKSILNSIVASTCNPESLLKIYLTNSTNKHLQEISKKSNIATIEANLTQLRLENKITESENIQIIKLISTDDSKAMLYGALKDRITKLDQQCGNILQHIPTFYQDAFQVYTEHQRFMQSLAQQLRTEVEKKGRDALPEVIYLPAIPKSTLLEQEMIKKAAEQTKKDLGQAGAKAPEKLKELAR